MDIKKLNKKVNKNIIMSIIVFAVAIATMIIAYMAIKNFELFEDEITNKMIIFTAVTYGLLAFLQIINYVKDFRKPGAFSRLLSSIACAGCCVVTIIFHNQMWSYSISAFIFFISAILTCIIMILANRTLRNIIFNILILIILSFLVVTSITYIADDKVLAPTTIAFYSMVIITLAYILKEAFYRIRLNSLKDILKRTYAFEILLGLLSLIVSFSFLFTLFEDINFKDALWYCFAVVTTIGFGDVTVSTIVGRILSVILGIYGIIVVAMITSVIVNFYNESKNFEKAQKEKK